MKVSEFKKYMQCGLGKCYLQLSACGNKEKYRKTVLYGCLHNYTYDEQTEGTRAEYIYELSSLFGDTEYFLNAIIEKFEKLPASHGDFDHLCDLLCVFAAKGSAEAKTALAQKYDGLYAKLIKKRKINGYNFGRDALERLANCFVSLDGLPAFLSCAKDLGNLFLQNDNYNGWDFEWFYIDFCNKYGKAETEKVIIEESKNYSALKTFLEYMKKNEEETAAQRQTAGNRFIPYTADELIEFAGEGLASRTDVIQFGKCADEKQKRILAEKIMQESDQNKQAALLQAFRHGGFPLGVDGLAGLLNYANQNLRVAITDVLEETVDPQAHCIAADFIKTDGNRVAGIRMIIKNYTEADRELLISALNNLDLKKVGEDGVHDIGSAILDSFRDNADLPRETLEFLYENSCCGFCRECAVEEMSKRGWLTEKIKAECAYDSYLETREFVENL